MTANVPEKVKQADLTRFVVRASQLEHVKPVISYWCEYWIVNQILGKGLHNADPETFNYTMTLMDKLEKIKADNATNDAILDDTAGQAYVEHFGLETFFRADRTVKANKVTKQTGDTFQAAATFLELLKIWAALDADIQAKIRYAKWNAVRIGKAIKNGKDPNESNPKIQPQTEETLPALDPNDPEVIALGPAEQSAVEGVPDERALVGANIEEQKSVHQSLSRSTQVVARATSEPSKASEAYPEERFSNTTVQANNVSPLETSPNMSSVGEEVFPDVPIDEKQQEGDILGLGLPQQPSVQPGLWGADFESFPPPSIPEEPPQDFSTNLPLPTPQISTQFKNSPSPKHSSSQQSPHQLPLPLEQISDYQEPLHASLYNSAKKRIIIDDVAIAKAQKHAKWAISALNFEDAETAVRELREALKTLGASS